jgi:diguanylate cyclase (GGDEF)-like protein
LAYLDTQSVLVIAATMAALMGAVSLAFAWFEHGMRALRLWGWSLLMLAAGLTLTALRGYVPDVAGIVIADSVLLASAVPMLRSVRSFHAEPKTDSAGWLIVALGLVLIAFCTYVTPDPIARIVVFSAIFALLLFRVASYLFTTLPKQGRHSQLFTAIVIGLFGAASTVRAVLTLTGEAIGDYLGPENLQALALLAYMVIYIAATLGIMWMEIYRLQLDLIRLATIDGLTGVLNRRAFLDAAEREISRCKRSGESFGFAMFDLDLFKRVNDSHGHPVGDKVLRLFADTLRSVVRPHDLLGRYGGEEFALLMPGIDKTAASTIVERCRRAVETRSLEHGSGAIHITASAGIAAFDENGSDLETLIKAADAALYEAKAAGRNCVRVSRNQKA